MPIWFTRAGAVEQGWVKRFAAADWTVDFPRGAMASMVTAADGRGLTVRAHFLRQGDLVGLIYDSEDRHSHPGRARVTTSATAVRSARSATWVVTSARMPSMRQPLASRTSRWTA